jgi:E3 ubiquitin-protein ligase RAD18
MKEAQILVEPRTCSRDASGASHLDITTTLLRRRASAYFECHHTLVMDTSAYDVPDSSDWLNTPLTAFASLENLLHCQICKEFYDTPMLTSCAHTFCSKCIRTTLSADGKCPVCTLPDQASKLRNNWAVQELVSSFQAARPKALEMARLVRDVEDNIKRQPMKRKRAADMEGDAEREDEGGGRRTTRSKARRIAASQSSQQEIIELDDSDADSTFQPEKAPIVDDGLVECPLGCGKRMKVEAVDPHIDRCEEEQKEKEKKKAQSSMQLRQPARSNHSTNNGSGSNQPRSRPQDRINQLHYSSMKDSQFSKKLKDLGIPAWGSKQLMINRHREWVNIWNANCDSASPRTQRELLRDLDTWERTQGGRAPGPNALSTNIMRKDFDGAAYSRNHQDDFSKLIEEARRKRQSSAAKDEKADDASEQANGDSAAKEMKGMQLDGANDHDHVQVHQNLDAQPSSTPAAPPNATPFTNGAPTQSSSSINTNSTTSNPDIRTGDETRIPPTHNFSTDLHINGDMQKSQEITAARTREPMFARGEPQS